MNENNVKFLQRMVENKDVLDMDYHPRYKNGNHPSPYFIHPKNNHFISKEDHIKMVEAFAKYSGKEFNPRGGNDWIISPLLDFEDKIIYPVKYGDKELQSN